MQSPGWTPGGTEVLEVGGIRVTGVVVVGMVVVVVDVRCAA